MAALEISLYLAGFTITFISAFALTRYATSKIFGRKLTIVHTDSKGEKQKWVIWYKDGDDVDQLLKELKTSIKRKGETNGM